MAGNFGGISQLEERRGFNGSNGSMARTNVCQGNATVLSGLELRRCGCRSLNEVDVARQLDLLDSFGTHC